MARIRTLELPAQVMGELANTPFIFVMDKLTPEDKAQLQREDNALVQLTKDTNAVGYLRTSLALDFEYDEPTP